jgi:hypothetical protein
MHALIDSDRIPYAFGGMKDEEGYPQAWEILRSLIDDNISGLIDRTHSTSSTLYLTSDDKSNFRFKIATILPYKGNRKMDKPFWYDTIRKYLVSEYGAITVFGQEADDELGIQQTAGTFIVSVDKDLDLIPGLHYNELKPEKSVYEITEVDAQRNFFSQLLCGDSTDNILGLFGVGRQSTLLKRLHKLHESSDMYHHVKEQYVKRFGSYWKLFMYENASLLWIKRSQEPKGEREVIQYLESLEAS